MNLSAAKKYRKKRKYINLILLLGLDLPFVVAAAVSLQHAVALSMEMLMIHLLTMAAALITVRALPSRVRAMANVAVSTAAMLAARYLIAVFFPVVRSSAGLYIYLMALNGMTLAQTNAITRDDKPLSILLTALTQALAFSMLVVVTSFVRELFGNGTLWGIPLNIPFKLSGMLVSFFGFILVGFIFALFRFCARKIVAFRIGYGLRRDRMYLPGNKIT